MKNPPGVTFMKEHDGVFKHAKKKSKSHATYIPTDQKLKDIRTGGQWAKTPNLIHGNNKK